MCVCMCVCVCVLQALQLWWELQEMGYGHVLFLALNEEPCKLVGGGQI